MAKIKMRSTSLANDPETKVPTFNFCSYQVGAVYSNNENQIDFITDGKSLYVCLVDDLHVSKQNIAEQEGLLKLISQGETGPKGAKGDDGISGTTPVIGAHFDGERGKQLVITVNGVRKAVSPDLTGPSWKPVLEGNTLSWELTDDKYAPESIDLMKLRPVNERPILLRTNSDNTKRSDEFSGPANFIQWKYEGDEYWTNLISISELMNLALAGVSFWEATDGKWHFGHREVVRANYISDKNGRQIISNVRLGDVLFDAGEVPFPDNSLDLELLRERLDQIEVEMVKSVSINGGTPNQPDLNGNVNLDLSDYAKKSEVPGASDLEGVVKSVSINNGTRQRPIDGNVNLSITASDLDAYTKGESNGRFQTKGDYVTAVKANGTVYQPNNGLVDLGSISGSGDTSDCVKSVTINGETKTPINGNVTFTITTGTTSLFDIRFDNSTHKLQKSVDGQNWIDLVDLDDFTGGQGCDHCWTENEILAIINSLLSNYYTKSQVYTKGEIDAMIGGETNSYRTFMIFKRSASPTSETLPNTTITWNVSAGELDIPAGSNGWTEHPANATSQTPYLWMASASFQSINGERVGNWDGPFCLTGENGQDGVDGTNTEFAYILCTKADYNSLKNTTPVAEHGDGRADDLPSGSTASGNVWTDHPSGISEEFPIEAVTIRKKGTNGWSAYCKPTIWSMWGEDGVDGDGVEYIFCVTAENTIGAFAGEIPLTQPAVNALGPSYQVDDWLPNNGNGNWTDNPLNVNESKPYEWVAIRKYHDGSGWGPFSEPRVWGLWGQKTITTTVVEDGTVYYKPYTCYAFTRTSTDLTGYSVEYTFNDYSQLTPEQKSAFYDNPLNFVKTLDANNYPVNNITWYDTVPNTSGQLWLITNHIGDEGDPNETAWNGPIKWGDNAGFQIEYAISDTNTDAVFAKTKTLPSLNPYKDNSLETINESAWRAAAAAANCGTWSDDVNDPVYMATAYKKGDGDWSAWTVAKVKGEDGIGIDGTDGSDGKSVEFVYYRTQGAEPSIKEVNDVERGTYDPESAAQRTEVNKDLDRDDFFPAVSIATKTDGDYWHDHPSGVTEQLPYEWVATRTSVLQNGKRYWTSKFSVALWSKYGVNGRDGDGIEYVFWGLSDADNQAINSYWPTQQASNAQNNGQNVDPTRKDTSNRSITSPEYLPAILINNVKVQAVDDNPGIENYKYVFASMRKYNGLSREWGEFSEIKLWNEQPASNLESVILDIEDDSHPVYVDENGRILDRYMDYTGYSTDGMYLYKNLILLNCGNVSIKGDNGDVTIATLNNGGQSNNYDKVTIASPGIPVTSNGITAHVYPYWAWKYEDSNHSTVQLRVVFDKVSGQNPILNDSFDIIIKVQSADGQYVGSDILRLIPKYSDKQVELLRVPGTQRTSEEGGTTYSDSEFMFYGWYGDSYTPLSLIADTAYYFKYDDQASWTKFEIPANNSGLTTLKNSVDGVTEGGRYFYFNRTGTFISDNASNVNVNGAFFKIWLYNSDYSDNNHGIWTNWNAIAYVLPSAFTATNDYPINELYFGIGFDLNQDPIDEANVHIIYPGKDGAQGDKGDTVQDAYFLTAVYDETNSNWATWFDNIRNNVSGYSWIPGELGQRWSVNIGTVIQTDTPVTLEQPTMTPTLKYLWKTSRSITYSGNTPSYGTWSVPVLASQSGTDGTTTTVTQFQYLDGQVMRLSDWSSDVSGKPYWNGANRIIDNNGTEAISQDNDGTYYLDIVSYNGDYYKCVNNTTKGNTTPDQDTTGNGHHWELFAFTSAAAFDTMLANNARINNLTSRQIVVTDSDNTVVGGMTSSSSQNATIEGRTIGDVRIWAGETTSNGNLYDAPFNVTNEGVVTSQGSIDTDGNNTDDIGLRTMMDNGLINIDVKDLTAPNSTWKTRARFGYLNGNIVLEFLDDNGNPIYDLGPAGITQFTTNVVPATWEAQLFYYFANLQEAQSFALSTGTPKYLYKYSDGKMFTTIGQNSGVEYYNPANGQYQSAHSTYHGKYYEAPYTFPAVGYYVANVVGALGWTYSGTNNSNASVPIVRIHNVNSVVTYEFGTLELINVDSESGTTGTIDEIKGVNYGN